ncbi:hypothetical protein DYB25_002708 [Aphanomyces astaci]|uniref:Uncharacterized protein n=1 Tax=Aphanomyces astaci TaxID=112090 RepID=A0A397BRA2_APHAT|nr:hypothetical protein DYB25_002708 [Aphanomyces astaci]RHY47541.1 hypothetical protein DYB34_004219 [Aphanomyces astaci]RHY49455.1 hypothetical protein DYB30_008576 [Aphanomyces astaci]RHY52196.1 hypothetical protein DYB38_004227 [Aphanomyces astaci]RHZ03362.1 hypothetical protein DYB31_013155 [Aphanomyces astaci]
MRGPWTVVVGIAVVVGQGNVAVDCARILTKTRDELAATDISQHALDALAASPSGIIGTNINCARGTVASVLSDEGSLPPPALQPVAELHAKLRKSGAPIVDWDMYRRIEAAEGEAGAWSRISQDTHPA